MREIDHGPDANKPSHEEVHATAKDIRETIQKEVGQIRRRQRIENQQAVVQGSHDLPATLSSQARELLPAEQALEALAAGVPLPEAALHGPQELLNAGIRVIRKSGIPTSQDLATRINV